MYSQLGHHLYCTEMQNYIIFKNAQKIVVASYVVGSSNETDIIQYVDTEANIATEVSLTILDLLCLYTLNHQVCFAVLLSAWSGAMWVMQWGKDLKGQVHRRLKMSETARSGNKITVLSEGISWLTVCRLNRKMRSRASCISKAIYSSALHERVAHLLICHLILLVFICIHSSWQANPLHFKNHSINVSPDDFSKVSQLQKSKQVLSDLASHFSTLKSGVCKSRSTGQVLPLENYTWNMSAASWDCLIPWDFRADTGEKKKQANTSLGALLMQSPAGHHLFIPLNNQHVLSSVCFSEAAPAIWLPECIDEEGLWHTHALFANQPVSSSSQACLCCPPAVCRQGNYGFLLLIWPINVTASAAWG